jgi:crotonobetainyl-CoA:carnitine CoA-transferase CaiB-like acyl-CoA transferase
MIDDSKAPYPGPLAGVRIVDLTRVLAGPYATTLLADLGAEVLKIEEPNVGDSTRLTPPLINGISNHFMNLNRNKQSIAVDLKTPEGRDLILDLVRKSDVVIENFRPGVLARLKLDYEHVKAANGKIIFVSISGFGANSSYRDRPSYDVITQALSGAMSVTGEPGRPPVRIGIPVGDLAGGLFGALAVLAALHERGVTGRGQAVDVSMLDSLVHLMLYYPIDFLNTGAVAGPVGGRHEHIAPYGVFEVRDGYLVLAIFSGKFWRLYCQAIGRADLLDDPRFITTADRHRNRDELYAILEPIMLERSRDDWEEVLNEHGIPHAPILTVNQVATHHLLAEREMFVDVEDPVAGRVKVSGRPIKFQRAQRPIAPAPRLGQHTRKVLVEVAGKSAGEVLALEEQRVVASAEAEVAQTKTDVKASKRG